MTNVTTFLEQTEIKQLYTALVIICIVALGTGGEGSGGGGGGSVDWAVDCIMKKKSRPDERKNPMQ